MSSICAECGSQVLDLKSHLKIHKDSKVECEVCGKVLTNRKAFRNHMQTHKSWSCPRCQIVIPHNSRTMHLKKCMKEEQKELKKYSIIAWTLHFKRLGRSRFDLVWLFSEFWISIWKLQSEHDTESSYNLASLQGLLWYDTKIHEIHQWWICQKHSL